MTTGLSRRLVGLVLLVPIAAGAQPPELVDRIVAVVDEDPVLESDLERVIGLGLVERLEDEAEEDFRRRVLDRVIEEKLRFHEIDRFGFSEISLDEVEARYQEIRSRYSSDAAFLENLGRLGIEPGDLRQLVARQLMVLTYVDERLGPRVFVSVDEIEEYYRETLVPSLTDAGSPVPDLDDVREEIREVVKQQRLSEELDRWTEELRLEADIEDYFDSVSAELPELVLQSRDE